jgi:hypothetical protein
MTEELVSPEVDTAELSTEAHFALWYSLSVVVGEPWIARFIEGERRLKMSARDKKAALQKGLAELADKGIVSLARDATGGYEPAQVHVRIKGDSNLILRDGA